jgi:hypothetical protein
MVSSSVSSKEKTKRIIPYQDKLERTAQMLYTTLKLLRKANACEEGMETLITSLGEWNDSKDIPLSHILASNGLNHAIWAMQATTVNCKREIVLLACDYAEMCIANFEKAYPKDKRPREAIQAAKDFIEDKIAASAWSAAWSAASAAWSAASAALAASAASAALAASAESAALAASAESAALAASAAWSAASAASAVWSAAWSASAAKKKQKELFLIRIS